MSDLLHTGCHPLSLQRVAPALTHAAGALARLDQATAVHPLRPALLYRARLDAVRRQAAIDGWVIDPWHLAAVIDGLTPRVQGERIADRGAMFEAARQALGLYQWLIEPNIDQEREVQTAQAALAAQAGVGTPLLAAAQGLHAWLERGGARAPARTALIRFWGSAGLLRTPLPITGVAALQADQPWARGSWVPAFLTAVADEATATLRLLSELELGLQAAQAHIVGHRRHSRMPAALTIIATHTLISATSLAARLDMSVKSALAILDRLVEDGIIIEITHRAARRLFGLRGLAPLREEITPPRRPMPGRGRGRPTGAPEVASVDEPSSFPIPATKLPPIALDYTGLEAAMAAADQAIRRANEHLNRLLATRVERDEA